MAATFDAIASATFSNKLQFDPPTQLSSSWNHTCVSVANKYLLISITYVPTETNTASTEPVYVDSLTYNGNACTFLDSAIASGYTTEWWEYTGTLYTTAKALVIRWGSPTPGSTVIFTASASSISSIGTNQTTPLVGITKATGTSTTISATRTGASANNLFIDGCVVHNSTTALTMTKVANSTQRYNASIGKGGSVAKVGRSSVAATGASQTVSWSLTASKPWATMIAEVAAAAAPSGTLIQSPNIPMGIKMLGGLI